MSALSPVPVTRHGSGRRHGDMGTAFIEGDDVERENFQNSEFPLG